ncbi:ATP-binding protein [Candidatus Methanoprimaticola sp. MG2]|uniref:ATP-binding protein n=1 Tax=Candidatus Methanoprimaticola sp. MG2 TaxID=3228838 RepID=UPI0039C67E31
MMELRRKAYDDLLEWKETSRGTSALLITGARRVGKSHLVKKFGKEQYRSFIMIDFSNVSPGITDAFINDMRNLDMFFEKLSIEFGTPLYDRESLIVFDEVQLFPLARQRIKTLVEDGRYDYIETGSLISVRANVKDILIPSEEEEYALNPLDFEEFLWAMGDDSLYDFAKKCFDDMTPMGEMLHRRMMTRFREYVLVGGMPRVVSLYKDTGRFQSADNEKRKILELYRNDIGKFANGYAMKVRGIFDLIPGQLSKKEKTFRLSSLGKDARTRDYEDSFMWLADSGVVNICFNSTDPQTGLTMNLDISTQKCYMADTGLLTTMAFADNRFTENELYRAILSDRLNINEGMLMENVVSQMLVSNRHRLFFYHRYDRDDSKGNIEIDFLVVRNGKICPIEVKSSDHLSHSSLDKFRNKFGKRLGDSFILYTKDMREVDGIRCLPLYMAAFI